MRSAPLCSAAIAETVIGPGNGGGTHPSEPSAGLVLEESPVATGCPGSGSALVEGLLDFEFSDSLRQGYGHLLDQDDAIYARVGEGPKGTKPPVVDANVLVPSRESLINSPSPARRMHAPEHRG